MDNAACDFQLFVTRRVIAKSNLPLDVSIVMNVTCFSDFITMSMYVNKLSIQSIWSLTITFLTIYYNITVSITIITVTHWYSRLLQSTAENWLRIQLSSSTGKYWWTYALWLFGFTIQLMSDLIKMFKLVNIEQAYLPFWSI